MECQIGPQLKQVGPGLSQWGLCISVSFKSSKLSFLLLGTLNILHDPSVIFVYVCVCGVCVCGVGDETKELTCGRQVLCHQAVSPPPLS